MTREEALQILDTIPTIGEQVDALEMAIKALSQVSEIEENIIKYMKKYPNHVGNTDFWEGFYACRNVVLQLDDEEYAPSVTQKSGKWITLENRFDLGDRVKCSECGQVFVVGDDVSRKYCPNCGAKMESEE